MFLMTWGTPPPPPPQKTTATHTQISMKIKTFHEAVFANLYRSAACSVHAIIISILLLDKVIIMDTEIDLCTQWFGPRTK